MGRCRTSAVAGEHEDFRVVHLLLECVLEAVWLTFSAGLEEDLVQALERRMMGCVWLGWKE